ncbi:MAG: glycosyltransferase family 2 protein [Endomicrobiaceae bacterium]|nr:glycosyltransferase family 2 protein [Endomicrobiaceae bacterium]
MKISIALCTYNGAEYLAEQLKSLTEQTLKADEVIICDDNSSDNTVNIINEYKDKLNIKLNINEANLGVTKNFEQAISLCSGDIIFLCDQDDGWHKDKIKIMAEKMQDEKIGLCYCNGIVADVNLKQIEDYTLWNTSGLSKVNLNEFNSYNLVNNCYFTGMALCFRKNLKKYFLPLSKNAVHDEWIAFIISYISKIAFVEENLVIYRQHSKQHIGINSIKSSKDIWRFLRACKISNIEKEVGRFTDLTAKMKELNAEKELITKLEKKLKHLKCRASRSVFRFAILISELVCGKYKKHSNGGYKAFVKDLFAGK